MSDIAGSPISRVRTVTRSARVDRLLARLPRYAFLGAVLITCVLGVRSLVAPPQPTSASANAAVVDNAAQDFAQRLTRAYLSYDATRPAQRERLLRPLVPEDFDVDAQVTTLHGSQRVLWTHVSSNQEAIAGGRIVVVAAGVSTEEAPVYLAVPVDRVDGAIGLTAYPSIVGPPISSRRPLPERADVDDREILLVSRRAIANYLAGDMQDLDADLARGAVVSPPSQPLHLRSVDDVEWAGVEGGSAVLVTVTAVDEQGVAWTLAYEVGVSRDRGRVAVTFVETVPTDP